MLSVISGGQHCQPASGRGLYPARGLHLVDIENLAGAAVPSLDQVCAVQGLYTGRLALGVLDQVVIASSHLTLLNVALGWPHARYRVRSGPDGADLELLDVLLAENIAARFTHVVIGSGDGAFAYAAVSLAAAGVRVTVVSRRASLSRRLALAAHEVVFIDATEPVPGVARQIPAEAA
jgi:NYN domain-containing protein